MNKIPVHTYDQLLALSSDTYENTGDAPCDKTAFRI